MDHQATAFKATVTTCIPNHPSITKEGESIPWRRQSYQKVGRIRTIRSISFLLLILSVLIDTSSSSSSSSSSPRALSYLLPQSHHCSSKPQLELNVIQHGGLLSIKTKSKHKQHILIVRGGGSKRVSNVSSSTATSTTMESTTQYVKHILNQRLEQVLSGKRERFFTKQYKRKVDKIDGKYTIVSAHGRRNPTSAVVGESSKSSGDKEVFHSNENGGGEEREDSKVVAAIDMKKELVFPEDLSSLELVIPPHLCIASDSTEDDENDKPPSTLKLCLRFTRLGINFAPVVSTLWLAAISSKFREKFWYDMIANSLARSGPAFIKWGQWASTRSDMFADGLCNALSNLHSDAPSHSWAITQKTVEQALSIPPGSLLSVFQSFDERPVASGSIAQVHRAVLCADSNNKITNNGITVAVKVRHPNVSCLIDMDFRIMTSLANIVDRMPALSWLKVRSSVEQFSHTMAAQAHLNVEAHHLEVLNHNFRRWSNVGFPRPIFAGSSVIVETFENGKICTDVLDRYDEMAASHFEQGTDGNGGENNYENLVKKGSRRGHEVIPTPLSKFIVSTGLSLYLKMLLVDNLMHADLHPGNIMLDCHFVGQKQPNNEQDFASPLALEAVPVGGARHTNQEYAAVMPQPKSLGSNGSKHLKTSDTTTRGRFLGHITMVDAGMVAQLEEEESANFIGLMAALGEGDGRAAGEAVLRFASSPVEDCNGGTKGKKTNENYDGYNGELSLESRELFLQDMIEMFAETCKGYGTNVDVGEVLRGVLNLVKKHRVRIDANYATLVVNVLCIESLARRVCPSYNVLDASKPLLKSYYQLSIGSVHKGINGSFQSKIRQRIMDLCTPILYMRKNTFDNAFFRRIEAKKRERSSILRPSAM